MPFSFTAKTKPRCRLSKCRKEDLTIIAGTTFWGLNGVNVFNENLVRELRARGLSSHVLLTEENTVLISMVTDAPMRRPTDIPLVELPVERQTTWGGHWSGMIRYLEEHAPCIYLPNYDWRHSCVCPLLSDDVGVVGVVHSDDPLHYDHVKRLGKYWNMIVTTSPTITQKTLALDPSLKDRIVTIPIGVDIPFTPPQRTRKSGSLLKLIYHGTLKQHQKRILDLPQIMAKVAEKNIPVQLMIAGDGPDGERVREAAQDLVKRGYIRFLGVVGRDKIFDLLAESDVYILASEFEGMPNALLEAMGRGCVPLVTKMESAIPDLVRDGDNGYVVPIGDLAAFAERLEQLQQNSARWRAMSLQAYERVSNGHFRIHDMAQRYIAVFERVWEEAERGIYRRPRGKFLPPPQQVAGINILPGNYDQDIYKTELSLTWKGRLPPWFLSAAGSGKRGLRRLLTRIKYA